METYMGALNPFLKKKKGLEHVLYENFWKIKNKGECLCALIVCKRS